MRGELQAAVVRRPVERSLVSLSSVTVALALVADSVFQRSSSPTR
jgi:hypothetical protein